MTSSSPKPNSRPILQALSRYAAATSVTILIAGQLAAFMVLGLTATSHLLGLPHSADLVYWVVSAATSLTVAVFVFVHTLRVEHRLARGEPVENVSWALFERPRTERAN